MSAENVAVVKRLYEWQAKGEGERAFELYDPEVEWDASRAPWLLELGFAPLYRGHDGVREAMTEWLGACPGPFVGPLSTGARAIYERTNGDCP